MFKKLKELLKDSSIYGVSKFLGQLINFALLPLYTSYLDRADYGITAMLTILILFFSPLANIGLVAACFRFISAADTEEEKRKILSTAHYTSLSAATLLLVVAYFFAPWIGSMLISDASKANLVNISILTAWFGAVAAVPQASLRVARKVKIMAYSNLIYVSVTVLTTLLLVAYIKLGVKGVLLGGLTGSASSSMFMLFYVSRPQIKLFDIAKLKELLNYGLPNVPHQLQGIGLSLYGQYMVKAMLSLEQAGLYNIAWKFTTPLVFVINAIQQAWGPYKFSIHKEDANPKATISSIFNYYILLICVLFILMAVWMPHLLILIVNEKFHDAAPLIAYAALIPIGTGLYWMLGSGVEFAKSLKFMPVISFLGLLVVVTATPFLIGLLGSKGAMIGTFAGHISMTILVFIYAQRVFAIQYDWAFVLSIMAFTGTVVLVSHALPFDFWLNMIVEFFLTILFFVGSAWFLLRSKGESDRVKKILGKKFPKVLKVLS